MTDDLNRFDLTAKLERIDTFETKGGKSIITLVFKIDGQWPQWIPIKVLGRLADRKDEWSPGDVLEIKGRLGGREWNGKVYGDNVATSVDVISKAEKQHSLPTGQRDEAPPPSDDDDSIDVPF